MPLGTATETVTYYTLDTPDDMFACIQVLPTINYRGTVSVWKGDDGTPIWTLTIDDQNSPPKPYQLNLQAALGQVVIWDNVDIQIISADEFSTHFIVT